MAELKGLDVSHWQDGLDLGKTGLDFAIMKATDGTGMVDPKCDHFVQQAKKAGMKYGVYHFWEAGLSATSQADYFLKNVDGYVGEALLALDWESTDQTNVSGAKAFLDRVHSKTGVKPVIYFNYSCLHGANWNPVQDADYGLWYARYTDSLDSTSPWSHPALWQHTSSGKVSGYGSSVDLDTFYGDKSAWDAYAKGSSTPAPAPTPKPRTIAVDGSWGGDTTALLQHVLGTPEDRVLSDQVKGSWNEHVGSAQWSTGTHGGSSAIKAAQKKLHGWGHYNDSIDGLLGPNTIKGFQAHYGTSVDGVVSAPPSQMVTAMQKSLNEGKF